MGEKIAVSLEDVEFFGGRVLVVSTIRPGTGVLGGVLGAKLERSNCNSQVEIAEDKLDTGDC